MSLKAAEVAVFLPFILSEIDKLGGVSRFGAPFIGD